MDEGRIHVAVRLRPKLPSEMGDADAVAVQGDKLQLLHAPWTRLHTSYQFDRIFTPEASNVDIFEAFLRPAMNSVATGSHATILAYGQTGTGKTHTMLGRDLWGLCAAPERPLVELAHDAGIMYLVAMELLRQHDVVHCSYLELYNDKVFDLLADKGGCLELREDSTLGVHAPDATVVDLVAPEALMEVLWRGAETRAHCATNMNERSSRSHTILQLTLPTGKRLNLVDLAGSEKCKPMAGDGQHVKELKFINQSLSNLGQCISALRKRGKHVPYRNCKLTRLLQHSFEGQAVCSFIVTLNPCATNTMETLSTLQFAARAMQVKVYSNDPRFAPMGSVTPVPHAELQAQVRALQQENAQLREALAIERAQKGKLLLGFTSLLRDVPAAVDRVDTYTQMRRESLPNADGNQPHLPPQDEFILEKLATLERTIQSQLQDIQETKDRLRQPIPSVSCVVSDGTATCERTENQWEEYVDASTGFKYFHNPSTGMTQWKKPV
ncbi:hypothetical protein ACHHYP_06989 [Achlya hypogyna]|uniref:Kinesin-like protein n=1 Tax=Achlya hypogyna TaxID=1202772 RepID=A0A1V9YRJ7_ACHHY|nr:hypothetical protein ACHHYP_06989 [Achlya hypogyna]